MLTEAEFEALREHLIPVRASFDAFCTKHGFVFTDTGRFPRLRIDRLGRPNLWFDLSMDLDEHGRRYELFRPDLPYLFGAGAFLDEMGVPGQLVRWAHHLVLFEHRAFEQISLALLEQDMERTLPVLESWDVPWLKAHGTKRRIR